MFAVTVELLAGRYVATQFNDRSRTEWPPHPARLFSAAVAAWADHDDTDERERAALQWWETLDPPHITCSLDDDISVRAPVTHFVPVNDIAAVARDTSRTYDELWDAEETVADETLSDKERAKALTKVQRLRTKAAADSRKAAQDGMAPSDRLAILPGLRARQAREYPTVIPADPVVRFTWPDLDPPAEHVDALDGLLARIPRLGHSSTPVSVWAETGPGDPEAPITLEPADDRGSVRLRVPTDGQLELLIRAYEGSARGTEPRMLPARLQGYRRLDDREAPRASTIGQDWLLLESVARHEPGAEAREVRVMSRDVAAVTRTLRRALMSVAGQDGAVIPEVLSGHEPRPAGETAPTKPTTKPHLMVLGLPFAGRAHATGEVLGLAVVLPPALEPADRQVVVDTVARWVGSGGRLHFGNSRAPLVCAPMTADDMPESVRPGRWSAAARRWVTVTPIALDRNPGSLNHPDPTKRATALAKAEATVAAACKRIGLPRPESVAISFDAPLRGTRPVRAYPPFRAGRDTRLQVHAHLTFAEPVAGPVVLGAGRFLGLGLCSPIFDDHHDDDQHDDHDRRDAAGGTR